MILLLDAGNTRVKWGLRQAGSWLARGVCPTREVSRLGDDLAAFAIDRALLCCVANQATRAALERLLTPRVEVLRWLTPVADAYGMHNAYRPPESLGADRYAALVAAARRGLGDCLVVSAGTALTVDALTAEGHYLGGAIAPGPEWMREALRQGTAGVRAFSGSDAMFPVETGGAVACGITLALTGVVAGMRERLAGHTGRPVAVLLSGGARAALLGRLQAPVVETEDLVLEGLACIAKDEEWDA